MIVRGEVEFHPAQPAASHTLAQGARVVIVRAMTAKVFDLATARARPRPEHESLRFGLEPDGSLAIRLIREDGIVVPAYVVPDEHVDGLLAELTARRRRLRTERIYQARPDLRPVPAKPKKEAPRGCHNGRDGSRGRTVGGCRRREKHEGQCRDEHGDFTPAACIHVGHGRTRITLAAPGLPLAPGNGENFYVCAHCNARMK